MCGLISDPYKGALSIIGAADTYPTIPRGEAFRFKRYDRYRLSLLRRNVNRIYHSVSD